MSSSIPCGGASKGCSWPCAPGRACPRMRSTLHDRDVLEGLVEDDDGRLVLTVEGRLLANEVAVRLR